MRRFLGVLLAASLMLNAAFVAVEIATGALSSSLERRSFPLLASRIFVERPNDVLINFTTLRGDLRSLIAQRPDMRVGLYFEYLPTGVSIGVNDQEAFVSASLLKTPFIMGIFRRIEKGFLTSDAILTVRDAQLDPAYGTLWQEGAGYQLTVEDAVRRALTESDNTAVRVLNDLVPHDLVVEVYDALDIPVTQQENFVVATPKNYASVFRCLYFACFLSREHSQHMLSLLTQSIFHEGIPAGIPAGIPFAHKVGIFDAPDSDRLLRLDCGIVYVPQRPYLLCVFIEGDRNRLSEIYAFASELSQRIYRYVEGVGEHAVSVPQYD